jgi:hypothetical protein
MKFIEIIQLFVVSLSLLAFSCSPQGQGILNSKSTFSETIDNATKQAPFAYDIAADTISYNSCVNFVNDTSVPVPIPGLTIGVSEGFVTTNGNGAVKGGLKLKTEFLKHVGKFFKPQSPSLTVTPAQVLQVLSQSPANENAFFQYSIRRKTGLSVNIDLIAPGTGNNIQTLIPKAQRDVMVFDKSLSSGFLGHLLTKDIRFTQSGTVLSEGPRSYNISDTPDAVALVSSFGLNQTADETAPAATDSSENPNKESAFGVGEQYSEAIRKRFNSNGSDKIVLTAVFGGLATDVTSGTNQIVPPEGEESISQIRRKTPTDLSKAFGRSYSLKFEPKVRGVSGWMSNVLSGTAVTETDLSTGTTVQGAQWSCENFVIALPAHFDNKKLKEPSCTPLLGSDMTEARQLSIKKIRRQHPASEWNVGLFIPKDFDLGVTLADRIAKRASLSLCVSPRRGSCYLPTTGVFDAQENQNADMGIQYDTSKECYLTAFNLLGVSYSNAPSADAKRLLGRCAQYLSVCTRTSTNF